MIYTDIKDKGEDLQKYHLFYIIQGFPNRGSQEKLNAKKLCEILQINIINN